MAEPPVTRKEFQALQKEVDEVRKWFQDEKNWTRGELQKFEKWFNDEKKFTRGEIARVGKS
jgi:predicted RNA-binding protein with EMAP domain